MAEYNSEEDNPYVPETTRTDEDDPIAKDESEWGEQERAAVRSMFPETKRDEDSVCPDNIEGCGGPGYIPAAADEAKRCSECAIRWNNSDLKRELNELESEYRSKRQENDLFDNYEEASRKIDELKDEEAEERRKLLLNWGGWETDFHDLESQITENGR